MVKLSPSLVVAALAAGCAGGELPPERSVTLHASAQRKDTLHGTLLREQARLLDGIRDLRREQLASLLTIDFMLLDLRSAHRSDGSVEGLSSPDSLSYYMILSGDHAVALPRPDAVRESCKVANSDRLIMVRLGPADWAATSWRDEAGKWRTYRLLLMNTGPLGEPPIPGAVCGDTTELRQ